MPSVQVLPPANGPFAIEVFGRKFSTTAGTPLTVQTGEAQILAANGWIISTDGGHGPTSGRPVAPLVNTRYTDTTVGFLILWDGKVWRKCIDGTAV